MDQKMVEVYDSLLTLEGMLTEAISECAEAAQKAHNAGLDEIANRLGQGILPQIHVFLDSTEPHSMQALLEIADGVPSTPRVQETRVPERQASQESVEYSHSGNPKYDEMFNNLLESSRQTKHTFKLDQAPDPEEIEQTEHPLLSERDKNAPRQPMERRKEEVAFDGMENWRSMINESSEEPGGDAGDIVNTLMNIDEGSLDMGDQAPSPNPPQTGNNDGIEVDPSIAGALAGM